MTEVTTIPVETLAEEMYQLVAEFAGKKNFKAMDLTKAMIAKHGEQACNKEDCKKAIRLLIDSGRCIYSYLGGSFIQLPPKEGSGTAQ
ncbi:MAG TPA: hypothetical protein VKV05_06225 [Terriglobales bacterium]|nr:hypothetical protein [Terriglobales bacterium]